MPEANLSLPADFINQLGKEVTSFILEVAERNVMQYDEFVQAYRTSETPDNKRTLEDYLGGMSINDFNLYWRNEVENVPGLTVPKGKSGKYVLYHGRKVQQYIAEHASEKKRRVIR